MKKTIYIDFINALLLLLFLYTSVSKLSEHERFKDVLSSSPLLSPVAGFISWGLPILEIIIVILLFIPKTRLYGLYASLLLLIILTGYLLYMILFTPHLPCNCGGVLKYLTWPQHIFFNFFFIALSIASIILKKRQKSTINPAPT